jgi:hypothetical protein
MVRKRSKESGKIPCEHCGYFPALMIVFRLDCRLRLILEPFDQQSCTVPVVVKACVLHSKVNWSSDFTWIPFPHIKT